MSVVALHASRSAWRHRQAAGAWHFYTDKLLRAASPSPPDAPGGLHTANALRARRGSLAGTGPQQERRLLGWLTEALPGRLAWTPMSTVREQVAAGLHGPPSAGSGAAASGEGANPAKASRLSGICSSARQRAASAASSSAPAPRSASPGSPAIPAAPCWRQLGRLEKELRAVISAKRCSLVLPRLLVLTPLAGAARLGLAAAGGGTGPPLPAGGGCTGASGGAGLLAPMGRQMLVLPGISRSVGRQQARSHCMALQAQSLPASASKD
jgi:hypothetical protein